MHEGSERIIAEHERRVAEIEALRAKDGSNAQAVDRLTERWPATKGGTGGVAVLRGDFCD